MEATIQSNQMDVDKEEARPNPEVPSLPQERHIWRMPELPPIPQGLNHFQVAGIEIYQLQYKNWCRAAKEEEWEICPSLWQGAINSYLNIKSFLGQEKTIELSGGWSPLSCKDKHWRQRPQWRLPAPEVSKNKPKGPQKKQRGPKNHISKGKGKADWHRPYPQGYRIPKLEPLAVNSVFNMSSTLMEFTAKEQETLGKFNVKINKLTSDISELKGNDKRYTEWYQLANARIDSIIYKCNRIERTCQVQNDEMEDLSVFKMNDQLRILKDHVLEIVENTNQFATHLAKGESERQKLKNEIIANVEQIHKNYVTHMPRHSTPLTEEKRSVKGTLTPFLGENAISAKDIPKLEEWPTFSGEGEYNHIEFIRTIDMLQEDFHIPDEIGVGTLHSLFTRTAKKWYYKMRMNHGKHDWSWWKSEVITDGPTILGGLKWKMLLNIPFLTQRQISHLLGTSSRKK
ncbi:hypothetical protein O181_094935, partial [Austropuccinia psidii MF-1]|nr:hypothetical protein [Austropuccinia psidii MF-1]